MLAGALLFTGLLGAFLLGISGRTTKIERLVEQRTAELRLSEARFRSVVESSPFPVFLKDTDGRFQFVNEPFKNWYGFTTDEIIGNTSHDLYPKMYADAYVAQDQDVLKSMKVIEQVRDITFTDGTVHPILITKFPIIDAENQSTGVGTINIDLTELKMAEERLTMVIESIPGGFAYFDPEDRLALFNSKLAKFYPKIAEVFVPGVSYVTLLRTGVDKGQWGPIDGHAHLGH